MTSPCRNTSCRGAKIGGGQPGVARFAGNHDRLAVMFDQHGGVAVEQPCKIAAGGQPDPLGIDAWQQLPGKAGDGGVARRVGQRLRACARIAAASRLTTSATASSITTVTMSAGLWMRKLCTGCVKKKLYASADASALVTPGPNPNRLAAAITGTR